MIERYCPEKGCPGGAGCINARWKDGDTCLHEYVAAALPEHLRWKGEGPPPRRWSAGGGIVYRSYADYCD